MGSDTGFVNFPTCLDPRAQEFRPIYNNPTLFPPHHQQIYHYPPPYPHHHQPITDLHVNNGVPFFYAPPPPLPAAQVSLPPPSSAPARTLLLSSVPAGVSESDIRRDLEIFGDVRAVQMERVRDGIVTVHFYDVRSAQRAATEIRGQHMRMQGRLRVYYDAVLARNSSSEFWGGSPPPAVAPPVGPGTVGGQAVWAQFKASVGMGGVPDGVNQGTVVVFNLDEGVNTAKLKEIFEAFGPVKELRETPMKRHQRFVEFYDVRHASRALTQLNGTEINGKQIVIEFSRPGGNIKKFAKSTQTHNTSFHSPPPHYTYSKPNTPRTFPSPPPPHSSFPPRRIHGGHNMPPLPRCYNPQTQLKSKKGGGWKGNYGNGFVVGEGEGCVFKSNDDKRGVKKNSKKGESNGNGGGKNDNVESRKVSSKMLLKGGRQGKGGCLDPRFLINNEEGVNSEMDCRDSRTTVMIKNIPNKYSQKLLLNMLDNHCIHCNENIADGGPLSSYDFVYLPIDFINKCNVGYGFVNMTSPQATLRLYKAFHRQNWEVFNSKKICEVTYARLQGVEALKEHFKNSKFPGEADEYLPVVFSPPRDGSTQLTDPTPIVSRSTIITAVDSLQSPSAVTSPSNSSSQKPNDDNDHLPVVVEEEEVLLYGGDSNNDDGCHNSSNDGFCGGGSSNSCSDGSSTTSNGGDCGHDPFDQ